MNEYDIINSIRKTVNNNYIGDDCAYLKELELVVTQDSLVEDIHFKRNWYTPYELGYKSVIVNISDILASGALPKYLTISLSLPSDISQEYVEEFYKGAQKASMGSNIIGGDITGSLKNIFISITALGSTKNRRISSRAFAKPGYAVITKGEFGNSAIGLEALINSDYNNPFVKYHIEPKLEINFSKQISESLNTDYAMMDTSDGLADALFKIAEASNVTIECDFDKIPHNINVPKDKVLFGGEDYKLVAAVPEHIISNISGAVQIGKVKPYSGIRLKIDNNIYKNYSELKVFNHFEVQ